MPFIVQCPHEQCRKYNLLEDDARGKTVECLVCHHHFKVEGPRPPSGNPTPQPGGQPTLQTGTKPGSSAPGAAARQVVACPHCTTPLQLPPGDNRALRCGRCGRVFAVRV